MIELDEDVLWLIFWMNTDMAEDQLLPEAQHPYREFQNLRALTTTRRSSQVCRRWRRVILGSWSPTLWGRVIDLDLLKYHADHWRDEVVQRTGSSPLYIRWKGNARIGVDGSAWNRAETARKFFEMLVVNHWDRIHSIDVTVRHLKSTALEAFTRPTKQLVSFKVEIEDHMESAVSFSSQSSSLFSGDASSLNVLSCKQIPLNLCAPWLSQLRKLQFSYEYRPRISAMKFLEALPCMPLLESLSVRYGIDMTSPDEGFYQNQIILPRLSEIHIEEFSIAILQYITPQVGCSLDVYGDACRNNTSTTEDFKTTHQILSRYFMNFVKSHEPGPTACVSLHRSAFAFHDKLDRPHFKVMLNSYGSPETENAFYLSAFLSECLSNITGLELNIQRDRAFPPSPPNPDLIQFLDSLTSLEVLIATLETVDSDSLGAREATLLFPSLKTLQMKGHDLAPSVGNYHPENGDIILRFITGRKDQGHPIQVLDLRAHETQKLGKLAPMPVLEKAVGLRVLWKSRFGREKEYICGSGMPEKLNFN